MPDHNDKMTGEELMEQLASYVLARARSIVPLTHGITVLLHEYEGKGWSMVSTETDPQALHRLATEVQRHVAEQKDKPIESLADLLKGDR